MIGVLSVMTLGIITGVLLRSKKAFLKKLNKTVLWIIFALLFFMGVSVGGNPQIMKNLDTIGLRGFQLAIVAVLGSSMLSWLVYHFFFKSSQHEG
jgi:uncharacterized membrane protein YbjE (DUF340 family)